MDTEQSTPEVFSEEWFDYHSEQVCAAEPPDQFMKRCYSLVKRVFNPVMLGTENLPEGPGLFIGNHSLFALDGMVLGPMLYIEEGRWVRGMGDRFMWNEKSQERLVATGAVCGDPRTCDALMENEADVMVFPGGSHEATKTEEQKYQLQWKERYGFVRMAGKHGYPIVPMAIVGPDEFYKHWIEGKDLPKTKLWKALVKLGVVDKDMRTDLYPPIPLGMLGSPLPKPQRCYVKFGKPVETSDYVGREMRPAEMRKVRSKVAKQIETMIGDLLLLREQQRGDEGLLRRILSI
ncbi:MAG: acyltransferase family protein [Gammaproteobacteria bacterium]|nr:acyltransferase family protein [Gammaproteobacteria bacterium]NNM10895.1 acyltransferase family protein [Pseudomonadales bacterium]